MDLEQLRDKIDKIDAGILELLNSRARIAAQIGHIKHKNNITIENLERENQIIDKLCQLNTGPLSDKELAIIFKDIMIACRSLQNRL